MPKVVKTHVEFTTPWFDLLSKVVEGIDEEDSIFYSLKPLDYVSVLAATADNKIILVKQYRPAVENYTLELPAGHVEEGESPELAAKRELMEETGYSSDKLDFLGCLEPDTGRLSNKMWCFFSNNAVKTSEVQDEGSGIQTVLKNKNEFQKTLNTGEFNHALHLAVLGLAQNQKKFLL